MLIVIVIAIIVLGPAVAYFQQFLAPVAAAAAGASVASVAGNVAGQLSAIGLGIQEEFDWGEVAAAGITGAISGGLSEYLAAGSIATLASTPPELSTWQLFSNGVIQNATSQGVEIIRGNQDGFNARGLFAGGIASVAVSQFGRAGQANRSLQVGPAGSSITVNNVGNSFANNIITQGSRILTGAQSGFDFSNTASNVLGNMLGGQLLNWFGPEPRISVQQDENVFNDSIQTFALRPDVRGEVVALLPDGSLGPEGFTYKEAEVLAELERYAEDNSFGGLVNKSIDFADTLRVQSNVPDTGAALFNAGLQTTNDITTASRSRALNEYSQYSVFSSNEVGAAAPIPTGLNRIEYESEVFGGFIEDAGITIVSSVGGLAGTIRGGLRSGLNGVDGFVPDSKLISNKYPNEALPDNGKSFGEVSVVDGKININGGVNFPRKADFVVTKDNKLILGNKHHFLSEAQDVLAAGTIKTTRGQVRQIDNFSGHFKPTVEETLLFPDLLRNMGLNLKGAKLEAFNITETYTDTIIKKAVTETLK